MCVCRSSASCSLHLSNPPNCSITSQPDLISPHNPHRTPLFWDVGRPRQPAGAATPVGTPAEVCWTSGSLSGSQPGAGHSLQQHQHPSQHPTTAGSSQFSTKAGSFSSGLLDVLCLCSSVSPSLSRGRRGQHHNTLSHLRVTNKK